jgi:hypothetical protein
MVARGACWVDGQVNLVLLAPPNPWFGVIDIVGSWMAAPGLRLCVVCEVAGVMTWIMVVQAYLAPG